MLKTNSGGPSVAVVQPADFGEADNLASLLHFNFPRCRGIALQCKQYGTQKVAVGTVKESTDASVPTWLFRKVRQLCEGGFLGRFRYFATLD